jgi:hypothetical protein
LSAPPLTDSWATLENTWAGLDSLWARGVFVELGAFTGLTLDDAVQGRLNGNALDGDISYVDVSDKAFSVSVNRGRNRDLERTNAGVLSVQFRNEDRAFDPLNPATFLAQYVVPRKPVRVSVNGFPVFTGLTDDWNFDYTMGGQSTASLSGTDGFSTFARQVNAGGSAVEEGSGARINRVLNQLTVNWPAGKRDIDDGNTILAAGSLEDNALTYLQNIEGSEAGLIFMTKDGDFAFRERLFQPITDALQFSDNGDGIPYEDIQISYGSELLANRSEVTSVAGTALADNATSQVLYGVTEKNVDTLLSSVPQLQGLADYIVARYGNPEYRIENVTVNLRAVLPSVLDDVLGLELGDQADVVFTPNGVGGPVAIRNRVIGVSHNIGVDSHTVSFSFEALPFDFFILDDAVFGKLDDDAGVLGF